MTLERPSFESVDRILVSGMWIDIEKGSLTGANGISHVVLGAVKPLYRYRLPTGEEGAVLIEAVQGWAPLGVEEAPPSVASVDTPPGADSVFSPAHGRMTAGS